MIDMPPAIVEEAASVDTMARTIMFTESGFICDPDDRGGCTNHGVSLRFAISIGLDANRDGTTDKEDVRKLTEGEALFLYKNYFYYGADINKLNKDLQFQLFDMAVHVGGPRAIRILQQTINESLDTAWERVQVDGIVGPCTIRAANRLVHSLGEAAASNRLVRSRLDFYAWIIAHDSSQEKFMRGWTLRAMAFWQL